MKLCFFDINQAMIEAWEEALKRAAITDIAIFAGSLDEMVIEVNPLVISSAGNAFGRMGAGIDGALRRRFPKVEAIVQQKIGNIWRGEMPVGAKSILARIEGEDRYLAYTPTMPYPGTGLRDAHGIYLAMRGLLLACSSGTPTRILAIPGMGTGIGGLPHADAARAQVQAICAMRRQGLHLASEISDVHR